MARDRLNSRFLPARRLRAHTLEWMWEVNKRVFVNVCEEVQSVKTSECVRAPVSSQICSEEEEEEEGG